ncbi:hypothetical protein DFH09DRAFT_1108336 [Mycena vulgaris]|nr:hypothetical protein DFH09DRAFT_1108336 [Mycena vulgaris]
MSSLATFCDVPVSAVFNGNAATSHVSLDWVMDFGLRSRNSQVSGRLTLPCDIGVISLDMNNLPVAASLPSNLVLGLDWLQFVRSAASETTVHLSSGPLDIRRPLLPTFDAHGTSGASSSKESISANSSSSVSRGGPGVVSAPSSTPHTRGVDAVATGTDRPSIT